jgi:hypothetical protein
MLACPLTTALAEYGQAAVLVIGALLAFIVFLRRRVLLERSRDAASPDEASGPDEIDETRPEEAKIAYDPFVHGSRREKRSAPRRRGTQVAVLVKDEAGNSAPRKGWILDRCSGGLGMLLEEPLAEGTLVNVRAAQAAPVIPWVEVQIRNCRQDSYGWIVGCQFVNTPPSTVLWQFG